jgi:integrase
MGLGPRKRRAQDLVKQVANRAGLTKDVTPHVLRHTFAATALQKGISLATVQKDLLDQERAAPELVTARLQRLVMARVETEYISTFDQDELTLAIGPPGQVSVVGRHFLRQWKGAGDCLP